MALNLKYIGKNDEYFQVVHVNAENCGVLKESAPNELSLLWFQSDGNRLKVDNTCYTFNTHDILCLTEFHQIEVLHLKKANLLKWNKHFYCIINHDSEVGCKGILFYGAVTLPIIYPNQEDLHTFSAVWGMMEQEMTSQDTLQEEMLQMMLKRILILSTRMYKDQTDLGKTEHASVDIIREYHFLVERHFKEKHTVAEYAELLHKSPKTLSNLFKKLGSKTPIQFINERKILEARRLLAYTDKTVSEIGYELGFSDVQSFSRFFKKNEGISPIDFRK